MIYKIRPRNIQNMRRHIAIRRDEHELVSDIVENIGIKLQYFQVYFQSINFYIDYIDFIIT